MLHSTVLEETLSKKLSHESKKDVLFDSMKSSSWKDLMRKKRFKEKVS
jgi:hypothetical protein